MKKTDTRVQFTKHILSKTLISLLKEKPISKITVREICDRAGLNRGTFYLHYRDPEDLLKDVEEVYMAQQKEKLFSYWKEDRDIDVMEVMFRFIEENRDFFQVLLSPNADPQFVTRMLSETRDRVIDEWMKEFPGYQREDCEFIFGYVNAGSTQLIADWLNDKNALSSAEFTKRMERLGHYTLLAIREF